MARGRSLTGSKAGERLVQRSRLDDAVVLGVLLFPHCRVVSREARRETGQAYILYRQPGRISCYRGLISTHSHKVG
ncbi:hypothetical protein KC356_g308 [Hortaea werneckii]|nr:hypothetical protein KC356_g308 [Hortaea werneckii]